MSKLPKLETPVNTQERFLNAIVMRLDVLIDQMSGLAEHISKEDKVAVESKLVDVKKAVVDVKKESIAKKEPVVNKSTSNKRKRTATKATVVTKEE